ncbi:biotin--[acetyl-CoA-carboxylase] ligase [Puniceicoccaceae bacterium K14]|nr:biotin--[acetyl-CoA-carboxylase] ligase [Puniceicoccaceae bacterium K14]
MENTEVLILKEMLSAGDSFVSGNRLADIIGVSRVAVWGQMEKLRSQGFEFEAVRSKGYRLSQRPNALNRILIEAVLTRNAENLTIYTEDSVDSTNSEAERLLANNAPTPFAVFSLEQTSGRGRLGREWHSQNNGNLYSSFAFRPKILPSRLSTFTLWMGLNICECINSFCRIESKIKWPNDILVSGKKVAGILTEARMDADETRDIVLGLGLNVNSQPDNWPEELKMVATSLSEAARKPIDINRLTAALCGRIMTAYQQFVVDEHKSVIKEKWPSYDILRNKTVNLHQGESQISGIAQGIDSNGSLIIERSDGTRYQARAGEVTSHK